MSDDEIISIQSRELTAVFKGVAKKRTKLDKTAMKK